MDPTLVEAGRLSTAPTPAREASVRLTVGVRAMVRLNERDSERDFAAESGARARVAGPFALGQVVGETYEIVKVLGIGGMNVVYEARDSRLGRTVAIKAPLFPAHGSALRREAQALAAVRSPSFVSIFHMGSEGDVDFVVMERLYGESLEARLDALRMAGHRMPIEEALSLLQEIASALSVAHARCIAHRDLKPANVVLTGDRVVLVDLGLFVPEVLVSPDNDVAGSIQYIAPEVLLRDVARGGGPLVDLYALGVLAFELLTNVTPFTGDSTERVIANHLGGAIPDVRTLRSDVPAALAALIAELLAKNPKNRPPGAESVLWQLRDLQAIAPPQKVPQVLVIDDELDMRTALKRSLESAFPSLHVEATSDPRSLSPEASSLPDVVLVDLHMPGQNGVEVCMQLLAIPADRRPMVVAMSSQASASDVAVLEALGVRHFVPKDAEFLPAMSKVIASVRLGAATARGATGRPAHARPSSP
jgi:eukaryotic-like serine/threonine-protein kinase